MVVGALTKPFLHMAMTEQAPLQVVASAPSNALAAVVAAAKIGAVRCVFLVGFVCSRGQGLTRCKAVYDGALSAR